MEIRFPETGFDISFPTGPDSTTRINFVCIESLAKLGFIVDIDIKTCDENESVALNLCPQESGSSFASENMLGAPVKGGGVCFASKSELFEQPVSQSTMSQSMLHQSCEFGEDLPRQYTRVHTRQEFQNVMNKNLASSKRQIKGQICTESSSTSSDEAAVDSFSEDGSEGGNDVAPVFIEAMRSMTCQRVSPESDSVPPVRSKADKVQKAHQFLHGNYMASRPNLGGKQRSNANSTSTSVSVRRKKRKSRSRVKSRSETNDSYSEFAEEGGINQSPDRVAGIIRAATTNLRLGSRGLNERDSDSSLEVVSSDIQSSKSGTKLCSIDDEMLLKQETGYSRSPASPLKCESATVEDFLPSCSSFGSESDSR